MADHAMRFEVIAPFDSGEISVDVGHYSGKSTSLNGAQTYVMFVPHPVIQHGVATFMTVQEIVVNDPLNDGRVVEAK